MSCIRYQSYGTYNGYNLVIHETYSPASLGRIIKATEKEADEQSRLNAAAAFSDFGDMAVGMRGTWQDDMYHLQLEYDVSTNKRMVRDANLAQYLNSLTSLLGNKSSGRVGEPQVPQSFSTLVSEKPTMPTASVAGDVFRGIGHALGLVCDYVEAGVRAVWRGVCALCGRMKEALLHGQGALPAAPQIEGQL